MIIEESSSTQFKDIVNEQGLKENKSVYKLTEFQTGIRKHDVLKDLYHLTINWIYRITPKDNEQDNLLKINLSPSYVISYSGDDRDSLIKLVIKSFDKFKEWKNRDILKYGQSIENIDITVFGDVADQIINQIKNA